MASTSPLRLPVTKTTCRTPLAMSAATRLCTSRGISTPSALFLACALHLATVLHGAEWLRQCVHACVRACVPELYKTLFSVNPHFAPSTHDVMLPVSEVSVQTVPALDVHVTVDRSILGALRGPWHCHAAVQSWFSLLPHLVHLSSQIFSVCLVNAYSPLWHPRGSNTLNSSRLLAR